MYLVELQFIDFFQSLWKKISIFHKKNIFYLKKISFSLEMKNNIDSFAQEFKLFLKWN